MKKNTITVDLPVQVPKELSKAFSKSLSYIDSLYELQRKNDLSIRDERRIWNQVPQTLQSAGVPDAHIQNLKKGIYDLYPITVGAENQEMDLVVGKVFASEGDRTSYYSGVMGVVNNNYKPVIDRFDSKLDVLCDHLSVNFQDESGSIKDHAPDIKCIDVFSLAGAFDLSHKPICIFFSGGNPENISTLSNMTVFINLYCARFKALTMEIARRHLLDYDLLEELSDSEVPDLLLIWLRGHDVGHFIGEDNLGSQMSQFDKDYMVLHELKSDIIALYSLRLYAQDLLAQGMLEKIYLLTVAEMLRYIRRGHLEMHPDSASAYLAWRYFEDTGAIEFDSGAAKFKIDYKKLEESVSDFTHELLDIFKEGNTHTARGLVRRFGSLENKNEDDIFPKDCPRNLREILDDSEIAYFIDYNFLAK